MRGSRNFRQGAGGGGGVQVSLTKKALTTFFFFSPQLILQKSMVNFKEIYHFSRFQRGPIFSRGGGVQLFPGGGGSNSLFPIETHITCDFSRGGSGPPVPPLDPHLIVVRDCMLAG